MAEVALTSIAKSALKLFSSLAQEELLLHWNSGNELKKLKETIETISSFLHDAEQRKSKEESVQTCLSRLRNVMYDAEDLFDALAAKVLRKRTIGSNAFTKEVRLFFSKSNQLGFMFKVAHQVKSLRESLQEIRADMEGFSFKTQIPPVDQSVLRVNRNKTHCFVHEEDIIGRDEDKDRVINMLLPGDSGDTSHVESLSVVALTGFGGLGKTVLAQLVYNDVRVEQGFEVRLWACLNDLSNLEQALREIIASREGRNIDLGLVMLQKKFREIIGGKVFLIVLDDVWDENPRHWSELETILRCGKSGSKVLVTTRSTKVAKSVGALEPYCELGVLSDESALSLFVKRVFPEEECLNRLPKELEKLGKEIVRRCGNVPLAIIVVGSLLRHKNIEERTWSDFLNTKLKQVLSSSDDKAHNMSVKDVLMVSYNDLHPNLKLCFAYCSLFPKDYTFEKDKLVNLWLSQGFIKPFAEEEQSLEEVGEDYFFQLVERCFFQEVKEYKRSPPYSGRETNYNICRVTAKMHDLLHDIAIGVAGTEIIFLDKVLSSKGKRDNLRHVSIAYKFSDSLKPFGDLVCNSKTLRTLSLRYTNQLSKSSLNLLLQSFKMLRTLCISDLTTDSISNSIGELIHLRYLDLSNNIHLKRLPSSVCKLHHLMIFVLTGCKLLEEFPPQIGRLVNLRQLYLDHCERLDSLPSGLRHLTSLVNLDRFIVHRQSGGLRYLNKLDNLSGVLTIKLPKKGYPDAVKDAERSEMLKKRKLIGLAIEWNGNDTSHQLETAKDEAKAVLEKLRPHESLQYLRISNYGCETLSSWVGMLKHIKELCLYKCDVEYVENEVRSEVCFPSLQVLIIDHLKNFKGWWRGELHQETKRPKLPTISHITISECPELKGRMPLIGGGIEYMKLKKVDVQLVTRLLSGSPNSKLMELDLCQIRGLYSIAEGQIKHLTTLKNLRIDDCSDLKWVSRRGLAHLTTLKALLLGSVKIADEDDDKLRTDVGMPWKALKELSFLRLAIADEHFHEELQYLTSLRELFIGKFLPVDDGELEDAQFPSTPLQNLRSLRIGYDGKASHLLKFMVQYLPSLVILEISNCKKLHLGWKTILNLNLQHLVLYRVENMIDVEEDMVVVQNNTMRILFISNEVISEIPWEFLGSVEWLYLDLSGEWEHIPDGIQHLTSLHSLWIQGCERVRSLPKWFSQHQFPTLTRLKIVVCSKELEKRCQKETGEDWPLIRHLDFVYISTSYKMDTPASHGRMKSLFPCSKGLRTLFPCLDDEESRCSSLEVDSLKIEPNKQESQTPQITNDNFTHSPSHTNHKQVVGPVNSELTATPASLVNPTPMALPDPISLPPPSTSQTPLVSSTINTNFPYIVGEGQQSFIPLEYVPGFDTGDIHFSIDDVSELVNQWNLSLVGAPMGANISYQSMEHFVSTNWKTCRNLNSPKIQLYDNGLFVFQFDMEEHLLSILQRGPWIIEDNIPLILRRWHTGMPLDLSCFEQIPVWVTLPNLDVRFWSHHMLSRVASAIGHPILTDYNLANQERVSFPRLLVQVSAKRQLLDEVRFHGEDGEVVYQRLQYEWFPPQCPRCHVFGHRCIDSVSEIQQASP